MNETEYEIKKRVERYLQHDDRLHNSRIEVDVLENSVKLVGIVPNYNALRAAENDAYMVMGVRTVNNYLAIEPPPASSAPDDLEIESNIRNVYLWDNRIDPNEIEITVNDGYVELTGTVYSFWEKKIAEDIARSITGVKEVRNELMVNTRNEINDEMLADKIFEVLDSNPFVDAAEIDVSVNEGLVTLSGTVQDYYTANNVYDSIIYIQGVRGVINNLDIG